MKAIKLYTHGMIRLIDLEEDKYKYNFQAMQKAIDKDCTMIDIVHAVNLPEPYCLVVDDESLLKGTPTLNLVASYLYGAESYGQPLCGNVLIMKDEYTPEGIDTVGLTEGDEIHLIELLNDAYYSGKYDDTLKKLKETLNIKEGE